MRQDYDDGKYTVIFDEKTGKMEALRYGEPWQDLCGNNLVYCMLAEHAAAQQEIARLRAALEKAIAEMEADAIGLEEDGRGTRDRSHIEAAREALK